MLEGKLPFHIGGPAELQKKKKTFWTHPEKTAKGKWPSAHRAFAEIIFKMLRKNPNERWKDFDELIKRLRTLEDESRALAKRTYEGFCGFKLKDNKRFFNSFYKEFFKKSRSAQAKFKNSADQPKKLMEAMVAVLNFQANNEPTSLSSIIKTHRHYKITAHEVDAFRETFQNTLNRNLPRSIPLQQRARIVGAWNDLFSPVVEYLKEGLKRPRPQRFLH
jgi:serine/threonine protein kinase